MNQQLREAREAVDVALDRIAEIKKITSNAKAWSWFDIMGNGMLGSYFKRQNIKNLNAQVAILKDDLQRVVAELEDIDFSAEFSISDTQQDEVFDIWFDNIFTDARVHQELTDLNKKIEETEEKLWVIAQVIDREMDETK
ncbi:hypothetical protein ERX37_06145 [Macrococcus hajekii]|uniref:Uncharacterized protein n=1 Tax=Macrococcus hajekii TaxID=198482 RepID=A0A4R6BJH3_9STAP|nr:hypothetical protein [Macrococcus hajekii]TDM01788.1 hypothetical protein ERX37_06145 [Macrococcus hajekii]GGB07488.1 hypothetical protein GCM10007190_14340 [Macrococcus hajekii]